MRAVALALLLASTPVLAQPTDAPVLCLTAAELALVDAALAHQHQAVAELSARNRHLEAATLERSPSLPVAVALAVGAALGAGAALLLAR